MFHQFPPPLFLVHPKCGEDLKNFLSHPVVEGVLGSCHPAKVGAVGLRGQRPSEGARRRAGGRLRAVHRLRPVHGLLQGQRGIGHAPHVDLLPGRTHIWGGRKGQKELRGEGSAVLFAAMPF